MAVLFLIPSCKSKPAQPDRFGIVDSFETREHVFVRSLEIDGTVLWVATSEGVLKIDRANGRLLRTYTTRDGMMVDYAFTVSTDPAGTTWFGTNSGGLVRVEGDRVKTFHVPDGLADPWVYHMAYQRDGTMWVATWNGVNRYDGTRFTTYGVQDGLINRWVYAVGVDRDDSVWFGTEGGLNRFDGTTWQAWTHEDGLGASNTSDLSSSLHTGVGALRTDERHHHNLTALDPEGRETYNENYIFSLLIDPDGVKWIGTWGGGVARFDGRHWKNFTVEDGLAGNVVYAIAREPSGRLWFGTNHGLSTYDGQSWHTIPSQGRYGEDAVYAVTADSEGSVWMGYRGGVSQVRKVP